LSSRRSDGAVLPAYRVATPVLERLSGGLGGTLLGAGATAAWVDLGGFVLAVTTREVPLLPNAVALTAGAGGLGRAGRPGGAVRCLPGRVALGGLRVVWDPGDPPAWDPAVRVAGGEGRPGPHPSSANYSRAGGTPAGPFVGGAAVGARGEAVLAAAGVRAARDPGGLVRGLAGAGLGAEAARVLVGRGPGLTPEGDDLLAAVAGTLVVLGPVVGLGAGAVAGLVGALVETGGRTTGLAATLLELAGRGLLAEPAGRLLDLGPGGELAWPGALRRLERLGHGSGRAYALGVGAAAWLLAAGGGVG